ncbi:hypothetical protein DSI38_01420, partial [Mycobacterium tuberculosis]
MGRLVPMQAMFRRRLLLVTLVVQVVEPSRRLLRLPWRGCWSGSLLRVYRVRRFRVGPLLAVRFVSEVVRLAV